MDTTIETNEVISTPPPTTEDATVVLDPPAKLRVVLEDTVGDKRLALLCYLNDVADVRKNIRTWWERYRSSELALGTVASLTQDRISRLRDASAHITAEYPEFTRFKEIATFLNLDLGFEHGRLVDLKYDDITMASNEPSSFLLIDAWTELVLLRTNLQNYSSTSPTDREESANAEKHIATSHPLASTLMASREVEKLADIWHLAGPGECPDRATADWIEFLHDIEKAIGVNLVTTLQIQLDVLDVMKQAPLSHVPFLAAVALRASTSRKMLKDMTADLPF
ncbi:hypothetical protein CLAFUW4_08540 [Fulvia fulva]|uniref:DUF6604 domain-containing protein n=1 Tax=Passalora fulva TaxID=5499 RepID=A0A9Q8LC81_PASFU|nr:uncharacterized protein CLAFUR5_08642 [Fulvia fulva]UJO14748.1 hypothetical protein CLAFUR5_08642 [Fulvia fulva]WPV12337.1 hypothetical protein CLAFUW4_08540 [Fulvia fulva]